MQIFNGASEMTEEGMIGKTPFNVADDAADDKNIAFDIAGDEALTGIIQAPLSRY